MPFSLSNEEEPTLSGTVFRLQPQPALDPSAEMGWWEGSGEKSPKGGWGLPKGPFCPAHSQLSEWLYGEGFIYWLALQTKLSRRGGGCFPGSFTNCFEAEKPG